MHTTALSSAINESFDQFIQLIAGLNKEQLNTVPYTGSWTAGQVAGHIILATDGIPDTQTNKTERPIDLHANTIESLFLDYTITMETLDFLYPKARIYKSDEVIIELKRIKDKLMTIANTKDLSLLCMDFEFPKLGALTRLEWLRLIVAHTLRHTHQLKRITQHLNKPSEKML